MTEFSSIKVARSFWILTRSYGLMSILVMLHSLVQRACVLLTSWEALSPGPLALGCPTAWLMEEPGARRCWDGVLVSMGRAEQEMGTVWLS